MSSLIFGSTISMTIIATPSSGWVLGYDVDGKLKQKDEFGDISNITSEYTLGQILSFGNNTDVYPIIMDTSTYISSSNGDGRIDLDWNSNPGSVLISSDGGLGNSSGVLFESNYTHLFTTKQSIELDGDSNYVAIYNKDGGDITLGVDNSVSTNYTELDEIKISYNSTSTASTSNVDKQAVLISSKNSQISNGVVNTVILGGDSIIATNSNSVYVPDLYPQKIKSNINNATLNLSDINNDLIIDRNNGLKDTAWFRISESEINYNYWSELIVNSSIGLTSAILIQNKDILTDSNLTSLKLEKDSLSLLTDGPTYSINFIINNDLNKAEIQGDSGFRGLEYNSDFSGSYSVRSIVDKGYVDNQISMVSSPNISQVLTSGNNTQTRSLIMGTSTYIKSTNGGGRVDLDFGGISNRILISTDDSAQSTSYIDLNGSNIETLADYFDLTVSNNKITTTDNQGLKYASDYSSTYINRSLVDKNYVDVGTSSIWSQISSIVSGTGSSNYIPYWSNSNTLSNNSSLYLSPTTTENSIESSISVGTNPYNSKLNTTNHKLYISNYGSGDVSVINTITGFITATISVGTNPSEIAIDESTNLVWVTNRGSNNVTYIDSTTDTIVGTISVGSLPFGIEKVDGYIYVANQGSNNISVIDTSTNLISSTISAVTPRTFAYDFDKNNLWVTGIGPDFVGRIDLDTNTITETISVGTNPYDMIYDPNDQYVYVTNYSSNNVSVIDVNTSLVVGTISVGNNPDGISLDENTGLIYVSNYNSFNISVINGTSVIATIPTTGNPKGLSYDYPKAKIYVSNAGLNTIQTIETLSREFGFVGINTTSAKSNLDVHGKITTNSIRITDGARSGYVLTSDSGGNATWEVPILDVTSGSGLTGGGTSGSVTLAIDYSVVASKSYVNSGTTSIWNELNSLSGDYITGVTAGNGLSGGGTSGFVTVQLGGTLSQTTTIDLSTYDFTINTSSSEIELNRVSTSYPGVTNTFLLEDKYAIIRSKSSSYNSSISLGNEDNGQMSIVMKAESLIYNNSHQVSDVYIHSVVSSTDGSGSASGVLLYNSSQTLTSGDVSINNNLIIVDQLSSKGLVYDEDYSSNFTNNSLVTKSWVNSNTTGKYSITRGFTASIVETITHNLGTDEIIVQAYDSTGVQVIPGTVQIINTNDVDITFSSTLSSIKIIVIG